MWSGLEFLARMKSLADSNLIVRVTRTSAASKHKHTSQEGEKEASGEKNGQTKLLLLSNQAYRHILPPHLLT